MRLMGKIYLQYFFLFYKQLREFKVDLFFAFLKIPTSLALIWFIWSYIFSQGVSGGSVQGLTFKNIISYFMTVQWIGFLVSYKLSAEIASDIHQGQLTLFLSKPLRYFPAKFSYAMGRSFFLFSISFIPFLFVQVYFFDVQVHALFFVFLIKAICLFYLFEYLIGMLSFWLKKIFGLESLIDFLFNVLGGKLIPLSLFPMWLVKTSYFIPTRFIYFEPAYSLLNQSENSLDILGYQLIYIIMLLLVILVVNQRGYKIYEATT